MRWRLPMRAQIGLVLTLFAGSVISLAVTVVSVLRMEDRRATAESRLADAGDAMIRLGASPMAGIPAFPRMTPPDWTAFERRIAAISSAALADHEGVEGGYYVRDYRRFVGGAFPTAHHRRPRLWPRPSEPPPLEFDLIETQADASIRKGRASFVVASVPPSTVASRTAPVVVGGEIVGAVWTMTRLSAPSDLGQSYRGYGLAVAMALGGVAVSLVLTFGLSRSLQRAAAERNRLQAELRRSERLAALGKLLAGVAHEVRNPLAGIRAITQLWRRGLGQGEEAMVHLTEEVDRLEGIVSRLLQFTRADAQDLARGDLNAVVAEAARLAQSQADGMGIRVEVDLAPGLPSVEMAAPAVLQLLRNLTTNAIQVMPEGGSMRIATHHDVAGGAAVVRVVDGGPGLGVEALRHLFEPFFTTKTEGTGLGLAIAREIAMAHRGTLAAANREDGPGAIFTFTIPTAKPDDPRGGSPQP